MSYDLVKNGIASIIRSQGFSESSQIFDFESASVNEYGNTFILKCISGSMGENSETLNNGLYDNQKWSVQIAFERSANNDTVNYDEIHRKKDLILPEIDDPSNWSSYTTIQKYSSWEISEFKSYIVLEIDIDVIDKYTY
jgi:hypothetical protein